MHRGVLLLCALISLAVCAPSLKRLPGMAPFLNPKVRAAASLSMKDLRERGWWLTDASLERITESGGKICFSWDYRYRSSIVEQPSIIASTCH